MNRTAEYSIKGYLYQFLRYLAEILAANDGTKITIEGAIEDVDIAAAGLTTAIQCKYHEQSDIFTLGKIYKPILLMLEHFSKSNNDNININYRLFCHFPGKTGEKTLTEFELKTILATEGKALKKIVARIDNSVDHKAFLERFVIEFGPSVEDLQRAVQDSLKGRGFNGNDIEDLIFPNAIQRIVELSTSSDIDDRTVEPSAFLADLKKIRHVTFTRWTRELITKARIFKRLRNELKNGLSQNSRGRVLIFDPSNIENFDKDIVRFIKAFVQKYSSKYLHSNPPLFMVTGNYDVGALQQRLYDAGLRCETGKVGGNAVVAKELFRAPIRTQKPFKIAFHLRLAKRDQVTELPEKKPDELFLVNVTDDVWKNEDINVHVFEIERLSELEYVLQLRDDYA